MISMHPRTEALLVAAARLKGDDPRNPAWRTNLRVAAANWVLAGCPDLPNADRHATAPEDAWRAPDPDEEVISC